MTLDCFSCELQSSSYSGCGSLGSVFSSFHKLGSKYYEHLRTLSGTVPLNTPVMIGYFLLAKENIGDLQENLRNVEDKLSAAETCKTMLNEEVLALRQAYDKLSSDLEVRHRCHFLHT